MAEEKIPDVETSFEFYALRHKATGHLMPEFDSGRGYSHWKPTPTDPKGGCDSALEVPRLFPSLKGADNARVAWANGTYTQAVTGPSSGPDWDPGGDSYLKVKDEGRSKDELEVVPVVLHPADKVVLHLKFNQQQCSDMMRKAFERTLTDYTEDLKDVGRFRALERMCGAWQGGSDEPVSISQDDATREFVVSVGRSSVRSYTGGTLGAAVDKAAKAED